MKHLIIYAHPSTKSFSHQLMEQLSADNIGFTNTEVRDLYSMNFNPVLSGEEIGDLKNGKVRKDVLIEQRLIEEADVVSVIYPLWWASFPGILKGYIDRVLSYGFGYVAGKDGIQGLLTDKKVVLHTTMGNSLEQYEANNLLDSFTQTHGEEIFGFCGMEIIKHFFYPEIVKAPEDIKVQYIQKAVDYYNGLTDTVIKKRA